MIRSDKFGLEGVYLGHPVFDQGYFLCSTLTSVWDSDYFLADITSIDERPCIL